MRAVWWLVVFLLGVLSSITIFLWLDYGHSARSRVRSDGTLDAHILTGGQIYLVRCWDYSDEPIRDWRSDSLSSSRLYDGDFPWYHDCPDSASWKSDTGWLGIGVKRGTIRGHPARIVRISLLVPGIGSGLIAVIGSILLLRGWRKRRLW